MKSFWNFLKNNKLYGAINLIGLTVSMAFVLLLAVYVQRQLSTDSFQENADRIYVIANDDNVSMGYWLDKHLKNNFPEIEKGCCVANIASAAAFTIGGELIYGSTMAADSTFFEMFSYGLVEGNKADWRVSWDRCMVSREFANAHFGDKNPLGQIISLNDNGDYQLTVCGVYEDFGNSILKAPDVLLRGEIMTKINTAHDEYMSNASGGICFVMTYPGADLQSKHDAILDWCEENFWIYKSKYDKVRIIPLKDMYFLEDGNQDWTETIQFGNRSFVNLLLAMCILLLAFAVLNYINHEKMAGREVNDADLAASFQKAVVDVLTEHSMAFVKEKGYKKFALAGGVASNSALRASMEDACGKRGVSFYVPSPILCTDNAAMIGCAGYYEYIKGERSGLDLNAVPNLKLGER